MDETSDELWMQAADWRALALLSQELFKLCFVPGLTVVVLLLWRLVAQSREPAWVKNAPRAPAISWLGVLTGSTVEAVKTGHMCRRHMGEHVPSLLRFHNGLIGGIWRDFLLVKDPLVARQILEERDTKKPEKAYRVFRRLHGYKGGRDFLSYRSHKDEAYARTRGLAYQTLIKRMMEHYDDMMVPTTLAKLDDITAAAVKNHGVVDIVDSMHHVATALLTRLAFDEASQQLDRDLFESAVWMVGDMIKRPEHNALRWLDWLPTPRNRRLWQYQQCLHNAIKGLIGRKRAKAAAGQPGDDVVSALALDPRNSDEELVGILGIFFFAGFDTTANTMSMLLYHLALNEDVQETARAEVQRVLGRTGRPSMATGDRAQLFHLRYLVACVKETLRLFPTVPMFSREVTEHHHDTGVCPRFDEHDTFGAAINVFALHYNPKGWSQPQKFMPERWLDPSVDAHMDPAERMYCPFALGKRACLGRQFAYVEMLTVVSTMLQRFDISPLPGARPPKVVEGGTLVISGLQLVLEPLSDAARPPASLQQKGALRIISSEEVSKHNKSDDLWMIVDSRVYDLTAFYNGDGGGHPGGKEILLTFAGSDGSSEFEFIGHSPFARKLLKRYLIGWLRADDQSHVSHVDENYSEAPKSIAAPATTTSSIKIRSISASSDGILQHLGGHGGEALLRRKQLPMASDDWKIAQSGEDRAGSPPKVTVGLGGRSASEDGARARSVAHQGANEGSKQRTMHHPSRQ